MKYKLKDFITELSEKTTINDQYETLTSSQNGIVSQKEYFNKQIASINNTGYKIIKKGDFTYRSMSDTGLFYINRLTDYNIGIVSPAYPVFKIINYKLLPEYLELFFKSNYFQKQIWNQSSGSTRLALKYSKLEKLELDVPPLEEQYRVVYDIQKIKHILKIKRMSNDQLEELIKSRFIYQEVAI